jgi:hypothetical protein
MVMKFTIEETKSEQVQTETMELNQVEIKEEEISKEPNIRVLSPIFGFFINDIVTPDSMFYPQFRIWATNNSTITVNISKDAEIICEFEKNSL